MARTFGAERELLRNLLLATRVVLVLRERCAHEEREKEHAAHHYYSRHDRARHGVSNEFGIHIPADWWCV